MSTKKRITVFASGSGSNFKAIHKSVLNNEIPASITALVSNKPQCGAVTYAQAQGIRTYLLSPDEYRQTSEYVQDLLNVLEDESPDLIVLAGYLKKIPDEVIDRYPRKIINIHPSLLPKFGGEGWYGMRVHHAVTETGESESGCTVHYINSIYDDGPIIAQKKVMVDKSDTPESLAKKVQQKEHELYPETVRDLIKD